MNLFKEEQLRHKLAIEGKSKEFIQSYKTSENLRNLNTGAFWDKKLFKSSEKNNPMFEDKVERIYKFLSNKNGKVLNIGFGGAQLENKLHSESKLRLYGIDISKKAVMHVSKRNFGIFREGEISKIPFRSSFFDYVVVSDVMEHISASNTICAYKEIYRVLKNNGVMVITVPINENLKEMFKVGKNLNQHVREYTPEILEMELKISGFSVRKRQQLFAFSSFYKIKSMLSTMLPRFLKHANLLIYFARK